jgi:hypothetical protein
MAADLWGGDPAVLDSGERLPPVPYDLLTRDCDLIVAMARFSRCRAATNPKG